MRKKLIALGVIALAIFAVLVAGAVAAPDSAIQPIEETSPCPATGCASGICHGFADVPEPDGIHEMVCPEVGCSSVECHAWNTLSDRYHQASDMSLNVWIVMPVILVVGLWTVTRTLSKRENGGKNHEAK